MRCHQQRQVFGIHLALPRDVTPDLLRRKVRAFQHSHHARRLLKIPDAFKQRLPSTRRSHRPRSHGEVPTVAQRPPGILGRHARGNRMIGRHRYPGTRPDRHVAGRHLHPCQTGQADFGHPTAGLEPAGCIDATIDDAGISRRRRDRHMQQVRPRQQFMDHSSRIFVEFHTRIPWLRQE